jgi:hypothetical protein
MQSRRCPIARHRLQLRRSRADNRNPELGASQIDQEGLKPTTREERTQEGEFVAGIADRSPGFAAGHTARLEQLAWSRMESGAGEMAAVDLVEGRFAALPSLGLSDWQRQLHLAHLEDRSPRRLFERQSRRKPAAETAAVSIH